MGTAENLEQIKKQINLTAQKFKLNKNEIRIIGVTKTVSAEKIKEAVKSGLTDVGENYLQEALAKINALKQEALTWHFIGHVQSNKVKAVVENFQFIHTLDSYKVAVKIDYYRKVLNKNPVVLVQVGEEESKYGVNPSQLLPLLNKITHDTDLTISGLMTIQPFDPDGEKSRIYFRQIRELGEEIASLNHPRLQMKYYSMGMSNDYSVAMEEGANLLRIGTKIFGVRKEQLN